MRRFYFYEVLQNKQIKEINPSESRDFLRQVHNWFQNIKKEKFTNFIISEENNYYFLYLNNKYYIIDDYLKILDWNIKNIEKDYLKFLGSFKGILDKKTLKDILKNDMNCVRVFKDNNSSVYEHYCKTPT